MNTNASINMNGFADQLQQALDLCKNNQWLCTKDNCAILINLPLNELNLRLRETGLPLDELIGHIVEKHLFCTKHSLPRFNELMLQVQLDNHDATAISIQIEKLITEFEQILKAHMMAEELILFPYIIVMEESVREKRRLPMIASFESVTDLIAKLTSEHKSLMDVLTRIREVCNKLKPTDNAINCSTTLNNALTTLERDLTVHIHLEEHLIFPFVLQTEKNALT